MRILLVHDYGTLNGGAEIMIDATRTELRCRGFDARLFTSRALPLPLPIVSDETCFGTVTPARRFLKIANPWARHALAKTLRTFNPDVVHVKMFSNQLSGLILPLLNERPSLLHVVNYDLICPINTKTLPNGQPCHARAGVACHTNGCLPWLGVARSLVEQRLRRLSAFDRIVTNSEWVADRLRAEAVPVHGAIYNGVPQTSLRPKLSGSPLVGYAGRLIWKKGVDVLLKAFRDVMAHNPAAQLRIVGDGPERSSLERLAGDLELGDNVDFLGHLDQEQMEGALAQAWVQVVPSRWEEPFGLTASEGMMRGTAVIATGSGGLAEQVMDSVTGYLVDAEDHPALARTINNLVGDRELCEQLGRRGRQRALAEFSIEHHVDRFVETYEDLISA